MPTLNRKTADKMSLEFYRRKMPWRIKAVNHSFQLPDYFKPMLEGRTTARIADVGAGPISVTGDTWPGCEIELFCSDAMAISYMQMWGEHEPHHMVGLQDMEDLTYEDDSFDIVHCVNALDHTEDPLAAINEMLRIVKPGGWIYLRHNENEGEDQNYHGYHQHNISRNGFMWSKGEHANQGKRLTSIDPRFKTEFKVETPNTQYVWPEQVVTTLHNV